MNTIALSQHELDRLFAGKKGGARTKPEKPSEPDERNTFLSDDEVAALKSSFSKIAEHFKEAIDSEHQDIGVRKIFLAGASQVALLDFFTDCLDHDFLFSIEIDGHKTYLKLDSHLFSALSGFPFSQNQTTNSFQSLAMKKLVAEVFEKALSKGHRKTLKTRTESLLSIDQSHFIENSRGLMLSINWNENAKSFGVEKFFVPEKTLAYLRDKRIV